MRVLGIETSCDETAAAVLEIKNGAPKILSNAVSSQIKIHAKYGGVVPEIAARKHAEVIFDVIEKSLKHEKNNRLDDIGLIAVTQGPGLVTSLRVGVLAGQSLAMLASKPLVSVNHIEAHLLSPLLNAYKTPHLTSPRLQREENILFPALGLIVSGGHTELVLMKNFGKYAVVGSTRDDAVGEAFDKVAKILGLGYPGGPAVSKIAEQFLKRNFQFPNKFKIQNSKFSLPRPMINSDDFDFSFAGLKTAVLYLVKKLDKKELKRLTPAIAAEFQQAAIDVLIAKTKKAADKYKAKSILVGGGVSANKALRESLQRLELPVHLPDLEFTGDNAAMVAFAGWKKYQREGKDEVFNIAAEPNLQIMQN